MSIACFGIGLNDKATDDAVELMRRRAIRRIPVVADGKSPIGIVSLGDLARVRDPKSALGEISSASSSR